MDEIYFKKDETTEDKSNDKHTYTVYLTNGKVFTIKATDYDEIDKDSGERDFYDGDFVIASIKADLIYAILDNAYASEAGFVFYKEV